MNKTIVSIIIGVILLGGLIWIARPAAEEKAAPAKSNSALLVLEANNYDFGSISMAAGKVSHMFKIKNTGAEPVMIDKIYTSCMCTTATMMIGDKKLGPYGMPGHGLSVPRVNQIINPDEEASVEVVFDPAAHGPAGIGRIQRVVNIENNMGQRVELGFSAVVTP